MPMVMHTVGGWKRWSDLTDIVRHGSQKTRPAIFDGSQSEQETFIGAMHTIAYRLAPDIIDAIKPGKAKKLLDIGGASGSYTQAFLEASPEMRAILFDLPPVITIAKKRLANSDLIKLMSSGDFYKDELPTGHDLALLSAIIHQNSPVQNLNCT